jgi:hypothetical protein
MAAPYGSISMNIPDRLASVWHVHSRQANHALLEMFKRPVCKSPGEKVVTRTNKQSIIENDSGNVDRTQTAVSLRP